MYYYLYARKINGMQEKQRKENKIVQEKIYLKSRLRRKAILRNQTMLFEENMVAELQQGFSRKLSTGAQIYNRTCFFRHYGLLVYCPKQRIVQSFQYFFSLISYLVIKNKISKKKLICISFLSFPFLSKVYAIYSNLFSWMYSLFSLLYVFASNSD